MMKKSEEYLFPVGDCLSVFCEYMEVKAEQLGLSNNTLFRDPCGIENVSTARDMMRCLIRGYECEMLCTTWGCASHTMRIEGPNAREEQLTSTVLADADSSILTDAYEVLGGKTGTLTEYKAYNLSVVVALPDSEDKLACTVLYAQQPNGEPHNRFLAAKQALDAAVAKYRDRSVDTTAAEVCAESAIVCVIPPRCEAEEYHAQLDVLYEKNAGEQKRPASMTKMLTAVIAAEYLPDGEERLIVRKDVLDSFSSGFYAGDFKAGDVVSVSDLLHAMMLSSDNAAAFVLAAEVGERILNDFA